MLRYILFHHQTTTSHKRRYARLGCVISSFITKPQLGAWSAVVQARCVISSFITKPQPQRMHPALPARCVISSFITKPQQAHSRVHSKECCVISSFITKPQQLGDVIVTADVALYPLSSPNHNRNVSSTTA